MLTVKMLKPYYIKADANDIRIILAYQYFSILINEKLFQFIPVEAKEIRMNRKTYRVENVDAKFAFQKGKEIVYVTMAELISLPDFLNQLYAIIEPYYEQNKDIQEANEQPDITAIVDELEKENIKRLIDHSLDSRDKDSFDKLVKLL